MNRLKQQRNKRLSLIAGALLMLIAIMGAYAVGQEALGGTIMLGAGITLLPGCSSINQQACNPCDAEESGRVSGIGFSLVPLTDPSDQAEWETKVLAGVAVIIPAVNGEYSATPTKAPGMGRTEEQTVGFKHNLKFDLFKRGNYTDFFDALNYATDYYLYWVTDTRIYYSGTTVNSATSFKIEKTIDSKVMWVSEIVWNYRLQPSDTVKPAIIFDQCVEFGEGEELGDGFGFAANPGRATSIVPGPGSSYDLTIPLGIVNSSVPLSQATFDLVAASWPAGFTLLTASIPNTGVGAVTGSAVVRVDPAVATNWREVLPADLPLSIDAGVGGTEIYDDLWFPCDLKLIIDGAIFLASYTGGVLGYTSGSAATTAGSIEAERTCYVPASRTVEFGVANNLPGTEAVNVGGVIVNGTAQSISINAISIPIIVSDGGATPGDYLIHLVISEIGTDLQGSPVNIIKNVYVPITIT